MFAGQGLVPLIHLASEIAAAPFANELAFNHALVRLVPTTGTTTTDASQDTTSTALLWRSVETELRKQTPGVTLDELTSLRDHLWFGCEVAPVAIADLPRRYAADLVAWFAHELHRGPARDIEDSVRVRLALRWLRLALPRDYFDTGHEPQLSSLVKNLLEGGFAETHLHLGGALEFAQVWNVLLELVQHKIEWDQSDATVPFGDPERFLTVATCTAITACTVDLAVRWCGLQTTITPARFEAKLRHEALRLGVNPTSLVVAHGALLALADGVPDRLDRGMLANALTDLQTLRTRAGHAVLPPWIVLDSPTLRALRLLTPAIQAERFRVLFYRYIVQRPLTRGLQHFFRHFSRLRPYKRGGRSQVADAMMLSGAAHGLRFLEIRFAPESDPGAQREAWTRLDAQIVAAEKRYPETKVHVVVHFNRNRGGGMRAGAPAVGGLDTAASPTQNLAGWRYAAFHQSVIQQQLALRSLLLASESARQRIRALDVCTDESGIPTWAYTAPILALRFDPELTWRGSALRMTVHAGEDFVDLLTGLRRIWETIHYLKLSEGDRLGHALALGMDVDAWTRSVQVVTRRIEERMWDLVWAWSFLRRTDRHDQLHVIAAEVERLGHRIFGERLSIHDLHVLYKMLHRRDELAAVGYPDRVRDRRRTEHDPHELLLNYLRSPAVFARGQQVKAYETLHDAEVTRNCQLALRHMVSKCGLSIEVNVSSNLLIGNLLQRRAHPLWRFRSPEKPGDCEIGIVLGSDDPITFATTLPEEYQLAYDLLVNDGIAPVEALEWVNRVRRHSLSSRFVCTQRNAIS